MKSLSRGKRAAGDLIPWTISQQVGTRHKWHHKCWLRWPANKSCSLQFADHDFAGLSGARIVRIATHPDFQGMGYGSRALQLLLDYFEGRLPNLEEGEGCKLEPQPEIQVSQTAEVALAKGCHICDSLSPSWASLSQYVSRVCCGRPLPPALSFLLCWPNSVNVPWRGWTTLE